MKYLILGISLIIHGLVMALIPIRDAKKVWKRYKEDEDVIHYISVKGCNYRSDLWDYIYLSIGGVVTIVVGTVILLV